MVVRLAVNPFEQVENCLSGFQEPLRSVLDKAWLDKSTDDGIEAATIWLHQTAATFHKALKRTRILAPHITREYTRIAKRANPDKASLWLENFLDEKILIAGTLLTIESSDQTIKSQAEKLARKCYGNFFEGTQTHNTKHQRLKYWLMSGKTICTGIGLEYPLPEAKQQKAKTLDHLEENILSACSRLICEKWWRKKLRVLQARKLEIVNRELGLVNKKRGIYCSGMTLQRRLRQKKQNRELLENMVAVNQFGDEYTLAQLADTSTSKPANRRAELMTRIRGFEEWAEADTGGNWAAVFITATCPSQYHSHGRTGHRYKSWNGSTPIEAQQYLCSVWAKVRASWKRANVTVFGFRIAEPHHDGCPHWHMVLWMPKGQVQAAMETYKAYMLGDTLPPTAARFKRGFTWKIIEPSEGASATGYISKYICKNIDGITDETGKEMQKGAAIKAMRVEAWATTWGIRQFQQIGGASVTVWREMRRITREQLDLFGADCAEVTAVFQAVEDKDWKEYTTAQGGAIVARAAQVVRAWFVLKTEDNQNPPKPLFNLYGDVVQQIKGFFCGELNIKTRLFEWTIAVNRAPPARALGLCH